jgi:hypothetical protein
MYQKFALAINLLAVYGCQFTDKIERVYPGYFAILVDNQTKDLKSDIVYYENADVVVGVEEILYQIRMAGDTLSLQYPALTKDSLNVTFRFKCHYRIDPDKIIDAYKKYGSYYRAILYEPEIKQTARDMISLTTREQFTKEAFQSELEMKISKYLKANYAELVTIFGVEIFETYTEESIF